MPPASPRSRTELLVLDARSRNRSLAARAWVRPDSAFRHNRRSGGYQGSLPVLFKQSRTSSAGHEPPRAPPKPKPPSPRWEAQLAPQGGSAV